MRDQARVVVIGGGVTGCAILYHLAKMGWTDCVLLERRELTSGSSWHAAGSLFALTTPSNAALLQKYTIELYPRLEAESGQSCGYHRSGGLILARSADESTALKLAHGRARRNGIETQLLSPAEASRLAPILATDYGPDEPGLGRFVRLDKEDFIGREAVIRQRADGTRQRLASFTVAEGEVDCFGGEAVFRDGHLAGYVTSGGYGHRVGASLALGYVRSEHYRPEAEFTIEILGERRAARLQPRPVFDPDGARMRS